MSLLRPRSLPIAAAAILSAAAALAAAPSISAPDLAQHHSRADSGDCESTADIAGREACFASLPPDSIDECESIQPLRCAPFRDMHLAGIELSEAVDGLAMWSRSLFADGTEPAFVNDLEAGIREADRRWRAWRDAECMLGPQLDGMSPRTAAGLTEACRAEMTFARAAQLRARSRHGVD